MLHFHACSLCSVSDKLAGQKLVQYKAATAMQATAVRSSSKAATAMQATAVRSSSKATAELLLQLVRRYLMNESNIGG